MSSPAATRAARPTHPAGPPRIAPWFVLLLAVVAAAATLLTLVFAFQAVEPQQLTMPDGDQSRLPPQPEPGAFTMGLGTAAFATVLLGPLVAMWVAAWASTWAWLSREQLRSRDNVFLLAAAVIAVSVVALHFSSPGRDITREWLD